MNASGSLSDGMSTVLYVNPTAAHGGAEEALLGLMQSARALGYRPVLVVPRAGWLTAQCERQEIRWEALPTLPDAFASERWSQQLGPLVPNALAIARLARKWGAALVHSNTPRASYHGGLGARLAGVRAITHVHDIGTLPHRSPAKRWLLRALADRTLAVSEAVAQALLALDPALRPTLQVLRNGLDLAAYNGVAPADLSAFGFPRGAIVVGSVSAMTPWKGQDVLIEAFRRLHADHPETRLLIVGGSQGSTEQQRYEAQLHGRVAALGLAEAVCFTGWREDAWSLMRSLDIFAHVPTQPDPLPTVLLHAGALARARVATRAGGIPEMVEEGTNGLLVPPADVGALQAALHRLVRSRGERARLGEAARRHVAARFSQEQRTEGLALAYERCLGRAAQPAARRDVAEKVG